MRALVLLPPTLLAAIYVAVALDLYQQENWARNPASLEAGAIPNLVHPDAALGAARRALASSDYSDHLRPLLERTLVEAPASYQAALLITVYRANRLEDPKLIERGFETALRRFPSNGRLHLTYARWLLSTRRDVPPGLSSALVHIQQAMSLEEDLVDEGLTLLRWSGAGPEEWIARTPDTAAARGQLLRALVRGGHRAEALLLLERLVNEPMGTDFLRDAGGWALDWGAPKLALAAARRWREHELDSGKLGLELARATLLLARVHMRLEDPPRARAIVEETLALMDEHPTEARTAKLELLNGMGYQYLARGEVLSARSFFSKALLAAPYDTGSLLGLARAYRRAGDLEAAVEQYRKVLELDPHHAEAQIELQQLW